MPQNELPFGTILIAEDSEENRELLAYLLVSQGYRVIRAEDGEQALEALKTQRIDVALLDVMMPRLTGFAVCRAVKARPETRLIPVVLITGLTSTADRLRGIESGADDFLSKPVRKEELLARVHSLVSLKRYTDELENAETVVFSLARSIAAKDAYTEGHCDRLARYAVALGERLRLSEEERVTLRRAGIVHDIGKVVVPDHILLKPGPLDEAEWRIMKTHPVVGERICAPLKSFRAVLPIIRHHHEHQDGSGYPDGLRSRDIPLGARILQTADVYDALTTERPYRKALPPERALAILREEMRRGWWDAALLGELEGLLNDRPALASTHVA